MILHVCNHVGCPSAVPFRTKIEELIRQGMDREAILARFVADEGPIVLAAPPMKGFNLTAWVMPFAALLLGGAGLALFLRARRFPAPARPSAQPAPAAAPGDPRYDARVDAELRDYGD